MSKRIGFYGGTFNPVHNGHVALVQAALKKLDKVIVMPCRISPHKLHQQTDQNFVSGEHRHAMLVACFQKIPEVEVSRWEIDRKDVSFTWMSLEAMRHKHPGDQVVLIMGWDQFAVLPTWDKFEYWTPGTEFLVFRRQGIENQNPITKSCERLRYKVAEELLPEISSSELRLQMSAGEYDSDKISGAVLDYIKKHGLYSE